MPAVRFVSFRNLRRCLSLIALGLLAAASAPGLRAAEQWLYARTAHFEMFSSDSEKESRRILVALEQFRANFLASFPFQGAGDPRTTIVLFRSDSQFRPYKPVYEGRPKDVAGYCLPGRDEVLIAMTSDLNGDPTEVIFHEYIHLLLHAREARIPVWLNEGLAELYSTFTVLGDKVEFGAHKESHVAELSQSALIPLGRLFSVTHDSPDYNEERRAGIFYAQSWALTHYLVCGEDRTNSDKLKQFISRLGGSADPENAFREAFGKDYKALEYALRDYCNGGRYYKRTVPALLPALDVKFRPARDAEKDLALLNLRWRMHHPADTATKAYEILRAEPAYARPYELLAAVATADGDPSKAQNDWAKAAELNSDNPYVYTQLAQESLGGFAGAAFLTVRLPPERVAKLRTWTDRALELSPDNAEALECSALTEAMSEEFSIPAINRAQGRALKMRDPARTLLGLAIIRWRVDDAKTANDIVDLVMSERRADMATRSAAMALRAKLPRESAPGPGPAIDMAPEALAARAAVALKNGTRATAASVLLDRLLAERVSLAPWEKLEPAVVTAVRGAAPANAWSRIDSLRPRAAAGEVNAMFELAVAHACGLGAEFSPTLALEWTERAAQAGHVTATVAPRTGDDAANAVCQFLRQQRPGDPAEAMPPLDRELQARAAEAAAGTANRKFTVVYRTLPRYPESARLAGTAGEVVAHFRVGTDGKPGTFTFVQSAGPEFSQAVEECLRQWRFVPAIRDRQATVVGLEMAFRFQIAAGEPAAPATR